MAWATPPPLLSRALHLTVDIDTFDSRNSARIAASSVCAVISVRASVASFGFSTSVMTSRGVWLWMPCPPAAWPRCCRLIVSAIISFGFPSIFIPFIVTVVGPPVPSSCSLRSSANAALPVAVVSSIPSNSAASPAAQSQHLFSLHCSVLLDRCHGLPCSCLSCFRSKAVSSLAALSAKV